ncbi:MAG: hydroxymethylpyrimidine/phosphomethylpyrimidine kinase [Deltaproteobacteria bacterium]|nr:hydroxymethylpyrimidine/phosphomethylpyrimidine kinase [Deltaproteobacteria bacterium]
MTVPDVLICSGLDPSGGAGFLADARIIHLLGGRPVGVITAQTVQSTTGMRSSHEVEREVFGEQLNALLTDIEVKAVKLGLLGSQGIVEELGQQLSLTAAPLVWDPIAGPTRGDGGGGKELLGFALRELGRHLTLITPNTNELALLTGGSVSTLAEATAAARALADFAKVAVLLKGGHLGTEHSVDVLCHSGGTQEFVGPRFAGEDVHGTGCALSSAIATYLALGVPLADACRRAKDVVAERIMKPVRPGRGAPAIV